LPYCYILLFLLYKSAVKYKEAANIDRVISVELLTPETDPDSILTTIIEANMIYGPYGTDNPISPCIQKKDYNSIVSYSKNFPKPFIKATEIPEDGYPIYRRYNNRRFKVVKVRGCEVRVNNYYIMLYNPYLSRKYAAHINVEICNSVKAIKYIHKYIYKGTNQITLRVAQPVNIT
jgi:hypothetical protein